MKKCRHRITVLDPEESIKRELIASSLGDATDLLFPTGEHSQRVLVPNGSVFISVHLSIPSPTPRPSARVKQQVWNEIASVLAVSGCFGA